jgi:hypothetical protein
MSSVSRASLHFFSKVSHGRLGPGKRGSLFLESRCGPRQCQFGRDEHVANHPERANLGPDGKRANIPPGSCLVEPIGEGRVDVFWGVDGQRSAVLSIADLEAETANGHLVLLDALTD